jgi:FlaA1/EpsC-like NDP-sugar epimerase
MDLTRKLIYLAGFVPDVDIKIEFTGKRPGEKLYEELYLNDKAGIRTSHPKVMRFAGNGLPRPGLLAQFEQFKRLCANGNSRGALLLIRKMVPGYSPSTHILGMVEPGPAPIGVKSAKAPLRRAAQIG